MLPLKNKGFILFLLLLALHSNNLIAQDLESITLKKPVKVSGSLNASSVLNFGLPNNSPINYFLSGNVNFNLFGVIDVPVSVNYSDRKIALSQSYSFNQISINPTYKWATAHLGTNYMTFSPYTLNGHQSLGGGIELRPGNWEIQAMGGQFRRGQRLEDISAFTSEFRRNGYGGKVAYNNGKFVVGANFVKSDDIASSLAIPEQITEEGTILNPEQNLAVSIQAGTTLFNSLQLDVEYANSVITKDKSNELASSSLNSLAGIFLNTNATSESFDAIRANLGYNISKTQTIIGLGYERVDPGYTTHGGYYFVENIINYTANVTQSLNDGKINLNANVGIQQDGIETKNASRVVGSLIAGFRPNDKFNIDLNLSNFQSFIFIDDIFRQATRLPGQPIDSLDFRLISQNVGINTSYLFSSTEEQTSGISTNLNYLNSRDTRVRNESEPDPTTSVFNATLSYALNYVKTDFSLNAGLNLLNNNIEEDKTFGIGPTVSLQKGFLDGKLSTNVNLTLLRTTLRQAFQNQDSNSTVTNLTASGNYQPADKHLFFFTAGIINNAAIDPFINGTLGYTFTF